MRPIISILTLILLLAAVSAFAQDGRPGKRRFETLCAACHGADGRGGERGPALVGREDSRVRTLQDLRDVIRNGIPAAGMPPFKLPETQFEELVRFVHALRSPAAENPAPGDAAAGEQFFFGNGNCGSCHTVAGRGGWIGPDLSDLGSRRSLTEIEHALKAPGDGRTRGYDAATVHLRDGAEVRGLIKNESTFDLQLLSLDGRLHLLSNDQIGSVDREKNSLMPPVKAGETEMQNLLAYLSRLAGGAAKSASVQPPALPGAVSFSEIADPHPGEWPTYHGVLTGNRHSPLHQINASNVSTLAPRWTFSIGNSRKLEMTPVVVGAVMYVTSVNEAYALDARTGREIWHFLRRRTKGLVGDAAGGINRGVAILGDRVFLVTDNAHLLALHRLTGSLQWEVEMADSHQNYGATSAPLVVHDLVISGTSGGDEGVRGFIAAYKASTGERVWRFWTVPAPGEPLAETWKGKAIVHPCSSGWLTGTYDSETNLLFWPTGNPCPDYNGDERIGDNLYSDSDLAIEPETGKLRWYFQYTPHDLHDWDSTQTPMAVDAEFEGRPRKLLLHANRNGYLYVLDRTNGELLRATPFVHKLTWAKGIGSNGRPIVNPDAIPTPQGIEACPSVEGATNWFSNAYNPATGLFYLIALEKCTIYSKAAAVWTAGESYYGGDTRDVPGDLGQKFLRAIDLKTGKVVWEIPQTGRAVSWGGVLSTAGGVVFFCEDSGAFAAADAQTGKLLWHFQTSENWKASPMTYVAGGKQFVAVAAGSSVLAFALP
ncbi:MAG TPA: PQQ-dependent dehydrogenase, methanol/ethanol family [Bryobacteraceae bacterium]|nr:PQQ-dependent dehydrogenase, methanol/ethanol family [Bryobacteraceae bacterium]